jgi:hypothetical protein
MAQGWDTFVVDADDAALSLTIVRACADVIAAPCVVRPATFSSTQLSPTSPTRPTPRSS